MAKFNYIAMDASGKEVRGSVEASSQAQAIAQIRAQNLFPTAIGQVGGGGQAAAKPAAAKGMKKEIKLPSLFRAKVKQKDLTTFTRQLATLMDAGLPLLRSLRVLERQAVNPTLKDALHGMGESVESGNSFSEALANYPKIFDNLFINMVKAGEAGGVTELVLTRLSEFMEKAEKIKNKVKSAMIYPSVILCAAVGITVFLLLTVIPKFEEIFTDLLSGKELPKITQIVISISNVLKNYFLYVAIGIAASIVATFFVRGKDDANPHAALKMGSYVSAAIVAVVSIPLSMTFFGGIFYSLPIIAGIIVGLVIGYMTEVYTSGDYKSVKRIADQSETGSATTIISGVAVGMMSTWVPIVLICVGIYISYRVTNNLYGIALAAVGMLSTTGITVAVDAYGPIADNSGGIAEMSGLDPHVREITDKLDAVGNTTAAMGKGFAIGSAALTALALFVSYAHEVSLETAGINILSPNVVIGLLIGGMLPFAFSAMTMDSVSKAAYKMIEEVRRQFREIPGILEGTAKPDYTSCVGISTTAALHEMIIPGVMAVLVPLLVGLLLGPEALGGLLAGSLVTGVLLAIFMSNSGGAWDNAKKYIEEGHHGGKGSSAHKAAVVGDTVGDPFKDTSGPSLNILIKLMTVVSLVFAPLFVKIGGLL